MNEYVPAWLKKDRLTHLNFHFHFIRNLKFKDGTIIQKVLMRSSREPEIIIYLFYWYFLRSLQSGCLSSGGNDILGWASGLPKLHTEVSAKDDLMSTQVVWDFVDAVNCFEKKIHGLKLSKTITIQTALESERAVNAEKRLRCHQYVAHQNAELLK